MARPELRAARSSVKGTGRVARLPRFLAAFRLAATAPRHLFLVDWPHTSRRLTEAKVGLRWGILVQVPSSKLRRRDQSTILPQPVVRATYGTCGTWRKASGLERSSSPPFREATAASLALDPRSWYHLGRSFVTIVNRYQIRSRHLHELADASPNRS